MCKFAFPPVTWVPDFSVSKPLDIFVVIADLLLYPLIFSHFYCFMIIILIYDLAEAASGRDDLFWMENQGHMISWDEKRSLYDRNFFLPDFYGRRFFIQNGQNLSY